MISEEEFAKEAWHVAERILKLVDGESSAVVLRAAVAIVRYLNADLADNLTEARALMTSMASDMVARVDSDYHAQKIAADFHKEENGNAERHH